MSSRVKVCVVTGTRAEFGLLTPLMKALQADPTYKLQVLATGMHLSPEFGNTYQQIEAAGFRIDEKVEMLLSADSDTAIVKSAGLGMIGYADALNRLRPDWIVLLGDRFEAFAAAATAYLKKIPIIHLHGGEVTAGATDEGLRHSITKMSTLHFTATEVYRKRVLQLGEPESQVYNVGAIGLDNIQQLTLLNRPDLEHSLGISLSKPVLLVTYHPVTLEHSSSETQMQALLEALPEMAEAQIIFTLPNADADGRVLIRMIQDYVQQAGTNATAFTSLGQLRYLSLMQQSAVVVGNSSSGIIEAPSFRVPTVNIGDRQKGRMAADSVIHCQTDKASIVAAIRQALSPEFKALCVNVDNPYGTGGATEKIMEVLHRQLSSVNLKKEFVDRI
ncbi:UDP-N-acetylglucosamine 2-epimerase [Paracnuella aquatica]|uniref:UDP-N-acetylglucosamine 2-epimerase n=1 Tax=Paracnuella aquatica TaxID=2268757 RepID=UPI000DEFCAE9|nr:UDP-N-acetylglucosamine 2-epimerase [Paracnuella aquatica]RPD45522.1 UDP-N-acetylglucosamine 2-epimerase (hydrolyzing) [Paracnuella aquatica]